MFFLAHRRCFISTRSGHFITSNMWSPPSFLSQLMSLHLLEAMYSGCVPNIHCILVYASGIQASGRVCTGLECCCITGSMPRDSGVDVQILWTQRHSASGEGTEQKDHTVSFQHRSCSSSTSQNL